MSILAVDEVMLREPRLLVPGMQPLEPVKVDWSNPLTNALLDVALPHAGNGLWSPKTGIRSVNAGTRGATVHGAFGRGFYTASASVATNYDNLPCPGSMWVGTGCITVFAYYIHGGGGSDETSYPYARLLYGFSPLLNNYSGIGFNACNGVAVGIVASLGAVRGIASVTTAPMCFAWHDPDGNYKYQAFGGSVGVVSGGTTTPSVTPGTMGSQSGCLVSTSVPGNKILIVGMAWNRVLAEPERQRIFADPYQFLIPA